jgi:NAD(P)-dependent dehydrogenase (short-subunit alcohol dehydrogenase family)
LTINHGSTFMVTDLDGLIEPDSLLGIFANDTRFLSYYGCYLDGNPWIRLRSTTTTYYAARIYLTNPEFTTQDIPLVKTSLDDWRWMLESNLTSHFIAARTFLPVLQRGSSYTLIGGGAAEQAIPNYGLVFVPAAGQVMLTQVLVEENKGSGIRINEVVLHSLIATRERPGDGHPEWLTADEVGAYTAWLASDEASMVTGSIIRLYQHP